MKKMLFVLALCLGAAGAAAQRSQTSGDDMQKPFRAYLYNNEFDVYMQINLHDQDIAVPGQELYGQLPGFLAKKRNGFCWVITAASITDGNTAKLSLINDYGSEDLTAILTRKNDSTYVLRQVQGSTIKVPKNGKWQKLPKVLELKKR